MRKKSKLEILEKAVYLPQLRYYLKCSRIVSCKEKDCKSKRSYNTFYYRKRKVNGRLDFRYFLTLTNNL